MKFPLNFILAITLIAGLVFSGFSQTTPRPNQQEEQGLRIGTAEVALDVVVRDKKGRPIRDLTAADFEIYEDGVRQQIESFRLVARDKVTGARPQVEIEPKTAPTGTTGTSTGGASVIALVFDRLKPEARTLARKAALAYAEEGIRPADFTGVFAIDLSLRILQPYTDNAQLVSQAIDQATTLSTSTFASGAGQMRSLSNQGDSLARSGAASEAAAGAAGAARDSAGAAAAGQSAGLAAAEAQFAAMNQRMLETFEMLERNQQGYSTINALHAVINSLRHLPGRKTIIFFSEGLALPPAVHPKFLSLINAANRAGVSIYSIDAAGLRLESGIAGARDELNALAAQRTQQLSRVNGSSSGPMMRSLERNEDILRLDPHSGLNRLADETGGFLIANTNDLSVGMNRIDEDMRVHYVLTYSPRNQTYDGKFRQLAVKLTRTNAEVQTRKGYYALDPIGTTPTLDYEVAALAALNRSRRDNSFPLRLTGLHFPEANRRGLTPILAEVPMTAFTLVPDKEKKNYTTDFSIVALIKDEAGQVVQKLSQHYPLSGPWEKVEAAKKGEVLFYREADLPPGRYTIEAVAYDGTAGKASVQTTKLVVPSSGSTGLRLSSPIILKRADRLTAEERKKDNPFHFGEVVVYPNLGEPLSKATNKQVAFFFTAWTGPGSTAKLNLTIEVLQAGRSLAQLLTELPAADEQGRVKYASALPLENFPPGSYDLKLTVTDGQNSVSRTTQFQVEP